MRLADFEFMLMATDARGVATNLIAASREGASRWAERLATRGFDVVIERARDGVVVERVARKVVA